jgi:hypothetical protein
MTAPLAPPATPAYALVESLREPAASPAIFRSMAYEQAHEKVLLEKLGPKGWGRLHHFRHFYGSGWGETNNQVVSPRALEAFHRFLEVVHFPERTPVPSVFLTDQGGLELCWETASGKAVQVAFSRDGVEYFRADTGAEGQVGFPALRQLANELSER